MAVLSQQPLNVLRAVGGDALRLFALTRDTSPGDTPVQRWQFQARYPYYPPHASRRVIRVAVARFGGGEPTVDMPVAAFLRSYQLDGGYTPGPVFLVAVLAGLAGSVTLIRRQRGGPAAQSAAQPDASTRGLALGSLLFLGAGLSVLLVCDVLEFSWRYQLPALVTLVPAGALGIAVIIRRYPSSRAAGTG
jgi:hypothetical protein